MKKPVIIFVIICNCLITPGQVGIEWQKSYGGSNFENAYSVQQTADSGYIVVGEATSVDGDVVGNLPDHKSAWILRLNQSGDTLWTTCFQDAGTAYAVEQTSDNGFIVSCSGFTLLKLTSEGKVSWSEAFGGDFLDNAYTVCTTTDGGYITGGSLWGGCDESGLNEWFIVKCNQSGDTLWTKCFEDDLPGDCNSVKETSDGGFVAAGSKQLLTEINPGEYTVNEQYFIVKFNSTGDTVWSKTFGGSGDDIAYSVLETSDGGFILAGSCGSEELTMGDEDGWIIKLDENGVYEWGKFIGGSSYDQIYSINKTAGNGYVLCGHSISIDGDLPDDYWPPDYWIVKIDESGNVQWSDCFGGTNQDYGRYAAETSDGGYIMVGRSWSDDLDVTENKGFEDVWIVKLTSSSTGINQTDQPDHTIRIYPNPSKNVLFIDNATTDIKYAVILTMDGKLIRQVSLDKAGNSIDVSGLDKGFYIVRIVGSKGTYIKKIIKQ